MLNPSSVFYPLRNHRQLEQASCAVSGFECLAKLHGLIDTKEFPLQSDKKNQGRGFDDTEFLKSLGIFASADHYDIQFGLDLIEKETNEGRFPLVSCIAGVTRGMRLWHIKICALDNTRLVLFDPDGLKEMSGKRAGLEKELGYSLFPDRPKIHILTYTLGTP